MKFDLPKRGGPRIKGYKVKQDGSGKVTLERIPFYSCKNASAKIKAKKYPRTKVLQQGEMALYHFKSGK